MATDDDRSTPTRRYGVALLASGVALALGALVPAGARFYLVPELVVGAVAIGAAYGGLGPGLVAAAAAAAIGEVLLGPFGSVGLATTTGVAELVLLVLTAALVSALRRRARAAGARAAASARVADRQQERLAFLAEASRVLATSLEYETTLASVARLALLTLADMCIVDIFDEDGHLRRLAIEHVDPQLRTLARTLDTRNPFDPRSPHPLSEVLRSGRPALFPEIPESLFTSIGGDTEYVAGLRRLGIRSGMAIPLVARGRVLGAISLTRTDARPRFEQEDVTFAEDLAGRCATAIDNARLHRAAHREVAERRVAEERLGLAFEAAHMGMWDWDLVTNQVRIEWGDRGTFGDGVDAFVDRIHPDDRAPLRAAVAGAIRAGTTYALETRVFRPDGTMRWVALEGKAVPGADGRAARLIGVSLDVTERRRVEQRLAVQYETTRILSESTTLGEAAPRILRAVCESLGWVHGGLWSVDADEDVIRCVETWHLPTVELPEFEAVSRQTTLPRNVGLPGRVWDRGESLWIPDVTVDANFPRADVAAREGLHGAAGFPIRIRDEVLGVLEFFSPSILPPDDELLAMMATLGTQVGQFLQRRRAEDERAELLGRVLVAHAEARTAERRAALLAEASQVLSTAFDSPDTLSGLVRLAVPALADWCTVDVVGQSGTVERLAAAHTDPAREERLRTLLDRFSPSGHHAFADAIGAGRSSLLADVREDLLRGTTNDPTQRALIEELEIRSFMLVPLVARGGVLGSMAFASATPGRYGPDDLALAEDLGHRVALAVENARLYRAAQDDTRRKDEFLAMLGHELRNPLAAINAAMHLLDRAGAGNESEARQRAVINRQVRHLGRLVDDLLDVSRVVTGRISLRADLVDVSDVARRCVESLRSRIDERRQHATFTAASEPLVVRGDAVRLEQIVFNLLDNAIKYTPVGGHIGLDLERTGDEAVLRVRDDGMGISPELLPRVFDIFTQAERSLERAQGGLGLGLSLVRRLVEQHGGSVAVTSAGPDRGSEFVVSLPLVREAAAPPAPAEAAAASTTTSRHVLLIEDNADGREALRELLVLSGHRVEVAVDGPSGIDVARRARPDVALIDIGLPGLDGYQVAAALRAGETTGDRMCLVALTGYGQADDRRRALEAGFDAHLVKPIDFDELVRVLARLSAEPPA